MLRKRCRHTGALACLLRTSVLTDEAVVSLSSAGGEGQGEEAVVLSPPVRYIGGAICWDVAINFSVEYGDGQLSLTIQGRRGRATRLLLVAARSV
jgi:hypothetical protein